MRKNKSSIHVRYQNSISMEPWRIAPSSWRARRYGLLSSSPISMRISANYPLIRSKRLPRVRTRSASNVWFTSTKIKTTATIVTAFSTYRICSMYAKLWWKHKMSITNGMLSKTQSFASTQRRKQMRIRRNLNARMTNFWRNRPFRPILLMHKWRVHWLSRLIMKGTH